MSAPAISAQFLRHVANCLDLTGRSSRDLLADIGLDRDALDDPDRQIALADFLGFFEAAAVLARNPHFGLHAGRMAGADSLGPLGFLFLSAPTLRGAFDSFTRYLDTMQGASRNLFVESAQSASFVYAVLDEAQHHRRQDAEYSIGATYTLARLFTGGDLVLDEVRFEHERVGDYATYRDYFGCDVFFAQDSNAFSFHPRFLAQSGRALSPALHPIIERHFRNRARAAPIGLAEQVEAALRAFPIDAPPGQARLAARLGMSAATLNRRLRAAGLSWRTIVARRRLDMAARLLTDSSRDIADIALAVGYAESASFIRGFRRHFGMTPERYRKAGGVSAPPAPSVNT
jgi:AraC-like DNA-binding protein